MDLYEDDKQSGSDPGSGSIRFPDPDPDPFSSSHILIQIQCPPMPTTLITGATSGIGEATARTFAAEGWNLIITGRRQERLDTLAEDLRKEGVDVLPLCFDIQDKDHVTAAIEGLSDEWKTIDVLINNAGLALGKSPIQDGDVDDWDTMIDTNVKGLLYVSRAVMPLLIERGKGHIINLCSIAGKEAYKGGAVYNATKFAVDALSKAMRIDMVEHGIKVTNICPGNVETEFSQVRFKGDPDKAKAPYEGYDPLIAQDIADVIWFCASRPEHVNINDIVVMPTAQANTVHIHRK